MGRALVARLTVISAGTVDAGGNTFLQLLDLETILLLFFAWFHDVTSWKLGPGKQDTTHRPCEGPASLHSVLQHAESVAVLYGCRLGAEQLQACSTVTS